MKISLNGTGEPELIHYAGSFTIDGLDYHYRLVELHNVLYLCIVRTCCDGGEISIITKLDTLEHIFSLIEHPGPYS